MIDEIRTAWNAQADDGNRWHSLSEAEKVEWAAIHAAAKERTARQAAQVEKPTCNLSEDQHATFMKTDMQPFTLAAWQHRHVFTYEGAAKALGLCRAAYAIHLKREREGKPLPKMLVMACKHLDEEAEKKGSKK